MRSSYIQNNYGEVLKANVTAFKPVLVVELGVLDGYSAMHLMKGLKENNRGELHCYDLFEDYPHNHGDLRQAEFEVRSIFPMAEIPLELGFKMEKADAYTVAERYAPASVGMLHVDISNDGDTIKRILEQWDSKMVHGGVILFEGGTAQRDQVEWMVKYNRPPMKPEFENNPIILANYVFATYLKFPGLTMLLKKR